MPLSCLQLTAECRSVASYRSRRPLLLLRSHLRRFARGVAASELRRVELPEPPCGFGWSFRLLLSVVPERAAAAAAAAAALHLRRPAVRWSQIGRAHV